MADIQNIQSAVETINKNTSKVARHFKEEPGSLASLPTVIQSFRSVDQPYASDSPTPPAGLLTSPKQHFSQAIQHGHQGQNVHITPREPHSPPSPSATQSESPAPSMPRRGGESLGRACFLIHIENILLTHDSCLLRDLAHNLIELPTTQADDIPSGQNWYGQVISYIFGNDEFNTIVSHPNARLKLTSGPVDHYAGKSLHPYLHPTLQGL